MLEKLRQFGSTKAARIMLIVLAISFGAWGIEGFLHKQQGVVALTVNGADVPLTDLAEAYEQRTNQLAQMLGAKPSEEELANMRVAEQVVSEAIARAVMRENAATLKLEPAVRQLQDEIATMAPFQNAKGEFDSAQYRAALAQVNRTPEMFERELNADLSVRNFANLVRIEGVPPAMVAAQEQLAASTLTLEMASVATQPFAKQPTEDELAKFYELNPNTYRKPEVRSGKLLVVSPASLSSTISIAPAQIEAEYTSNKEAYNMPETRVVRHILLPSQASATAVMATITDVTSFVSAANQYTQDPGNTPPGQQPRGGALGAIQRTDVVKPFGDMAFTLAPNTLSTPVESQFGWHLIWVESINPAHTKPMAEVAESIRKGLVEAEANDAATRLADQVDEAVAGGAKLSEIAAKLGLKTEPLTQLTPAETNTPEAVMKALFATPENQISTPLTLPQGGVAYVETTSVTPASIPPLESIKARVVADWQALQAELAAKRTAEALLSAARAPATGAAPRTLAQAAAQAGVQGGVAVKTLTLKATDEAPTWLQPELLNVQGMAIGSTLPQTLREGGTWHVVRLASRTAGAPLNAAEQAKAARVYSRQMNGDMEALLISYLQSTAKVRCHQEVLKQVFGRPINCQ